MFKNGQCPQLANGTNNCLIRITTHKKNGPDEKAVSAPHRQEASRSWVDICCGCAWNRKPRDLQGPFPLRVYDSFTWLSSFPACHLCRFMSRALLLSDRFFSCYVLFMIFYSFLCICVYFKILLKLDHYKTSLISIVKKKDCSFLWTSISQL